MREFTLTHPWIASILLLLAFMVLTIIVRLIFEGLMCLIEYMTKSKNTGKVIMTLLLMVAMVVMLRYTFFNG
jgi:hypothetical protein